MLTALLVGMALAQAPAGTGTVRGLVVDARDGTPIRKVSVRLPDGHTTLTGDDGRFELTGAPAGPQELYVSVVDFILVKRTITVPVGGVLDITIPIAAGTGTYSESVTVRPQAGASPSAVSEQILPSRQLQQLRGVITSDPFRAIQVLPGVAAGDDLRSEFTVRGNAIDHMNFTFEGVPSPFLVHTVQGINDSGSVAMVNGDILDDIVLSSGSYPQRFGGRTGAELDFSMREGSRDGTRSHVSVSVTDAALVMEGPLGRHKQGSWLTSVRKSYLDRLLRRLDPNNDFGFGFSDLQTKMVYDVTSRNQLQLAVTAGHSRLDRQDANLGPNDVQDGRNATAIGVVTWRYLASPRLLVTQKFYGTTNGFKNFASDHTELVRGTETDVAYRVDWSYAAAGRITFDGGAHAGRTSVASHSARSNLSGHTSSESAYAEARMPIGRGWLTAGARVDHWALTNDTRASPWVQALWPLTRSLDLRVGSGIYRQEPTFAEVRGARSNPDLQPERAPQVDAAIEGRLGRGVTWHVTGYDREDRGLVDLPGLDFRLVSGSLARPSATSLYQNGLDGHSRGLDTVVQRSSLNGLSGWISYSLSYTKYHDRQSGETFWGDWDQRHTANVYAAYRFNDRYSASTRFRYGSNFPAAGYFLQRGSQLFLSALRNDLRVPAYSRLDMRVNRTFTWSEKRLTLFVEVVNVYNRANVRQAAAGLNTQTFELFGLFDKMFPRIPSAGFLLEF